MTTFNFVYVTDANLLSNTTSPCPFGTFFFIKNVLLVKVEAFSKDFYKWLQGNLIRFNDVILLKRVQDIYRTEKKVLRMHSKAQVYE